MMKASSVSPEIIPGVSVLQLHLAWNDPMSFDGEVHCALYPDGDTKKEPQFYLIRKAVQEMYPAIRNILNIPNCDWDAVMKLLGDYRWVRYKYPAENDDRGYVYVDYPCVRGKERWPVRYYGS